MGTVAAFSTVAAFDGTDFSNILSTSRHCSKLELDNQVEFTNLDNMEEKNL